MSDQVEDLLLGEPLTLGYRPQLPILALHDAGDVPLPLVLRDVEAMLLHPYIDMCLGQYKAGIAQAKWRIRASSSKVGAWADAMLRRFWEHSLDQTQHGYDFGWGGYENVWTVRSGLLWHDGLIDFSPLDTTVLTIGGKYAGVRVKGTPGGPTDLWGPKPGGRSWSAKAQGRARGARFGEECWPAKAFWFVHRQRYSQWYGRTQLYAAWRPWRRLAGRDGAEQVVDMGFYRFAYRGPVGRYPPEDKMPPGSTHDSARKTARDKMRELVEAAKAGVSVALPSTKYPSEMGGDYKWTLDFPDHTLSVEGLLGYPDYLKGQIAYGIGMPPELIEASEVGSGWSGRRIPLVAYFAGQQKNARAIVRSWYLQIAAPACRWNFGPDAWFEVELLPLMPPDQPQPGAQSQGAPAPGGGGGGQWQQTTGPRGGQQLVNMATGEKRYGSLSLVRLSTADEWAPYQGEHGGKGWKNSRTGLIRYQEQKPGQDEGREQPPGRPPRSPGQVAVSFANQLLGIRTDLVNGDTDPDQARQAAAELSDRATHAARRTAAAAARRVEQDALARHGDEPTVRDLAGAAAARIRDAYDTLAEVIADATDGFLDADHSDRDAHRGDLASASANLQRTIDTAGDFIAANLEPAGRSRQLQDAVRRGMKIAARLEAGRPLRPQDEQALRELSDEGRFWRVGVEDGKLLARYPGGERPIHITSEGGREVRPPAANLATGAHSPAGGATVAGKFYPGGQFIPSDVMAQASHEERRQVLAGRSRKQRQRDKRATRGQPQGADEPTEPDPAAKRAVQRQLLASLPRGFDAAKDLARRLGRAVTGEMALAWGLARAVEHRLSAGVEAAQRKVVEAAARRGKSPEHAVRIASLVATADAIASWTVNVPLAHAGLHAAGVEGTAAIAASKLAYYVPVGSLAYLAYAKAADGFDVLKRAAARLRPGRPFRLATEADAAIDLLLDAFDSAEDTELLHAMLALALEQTQGDLAGAVRLVEQSGPAELSLTRFGPGEDAAAALRRLAVQIRRTLLRSVRPGMLGSQVLGRLRELLARHQAELVRHLADQHLAEALQAMRRVVESLPGTPPLPGTGETPAASSADLPWSPAPVPGDALGAPRLPLIEEAVRDLRSRVPLTRQAFDRLDSEARDRAFTLAGAETEALVGKVRDVMADVVESGASLREFRRRLESEGLSGTFLSPGHLETVWRTNVQEALSRGQEAILEPPLVGDAFPYAAYEALHDDRVRPEHRELERRGLDGTNVYRRDDRFWDKFTPPWDFNCRCSKIPLTVEQAARRGVAEAQKWLESGQPPASPQHVEPPPFEPPAEFRRS